ncbi:MAG: non-homologous end-joining DNA ligase [Candidatus Eremiobacter antarcticus]|nr:hypothetical protein [Candidatus Eremiobacteraeota bacterium]MBC5808984.1 hypothetical protein [Candidatus Eremiobacteraeota bacterium]
MKAPKSTASRAKTVPPGSPKEQIVAIGGKRVKLTNLDKVLWPADGYTKGDLIAYYRDVASWLLPYLRGRPLTLQRFPNGIDEGSFFEKDVPRGAPDWVKTIELPAYGRHASVEYILCDDEATLAFVANLASITLHVWTSQVGTLDNPDCALFDLDPWEGCSLSTLASVALELRDMLKHVGLGPLVKTSGGTGLHVIVTLAPKHDYDTVKAFAEVIARGLAEERPRQVTLERTIAKRPRGTVYIDWVQVGKGKTIVPPYVVRARKGAPVSMPLAWSDVEAMVRKKARDPHSEFARWSIANVRALLAQNGDPWKREARKKQSLEFALRPRPRGSRRR